MRNLREILTKYKVNNLFKQFSENVKTQKVENEKINETKTQENTYINQFKKLWKHTFNYAESIEEIIERRKAEAALKKSNVVELTEEQADRVIIYNLVRTNY